MGKDINCSSSDSLTLSNEDNMPSLELNHVSYVCKSVPESVKFYEQVLGFGLMKRPSSLKFEGAWLFKHGIGIHLLGKKDVESKKREIDPKDNHIAFQCPDMNLITQRLKDMNIEYKDNKIEYEDNKIEGGKGTVDQVFFHDPDGNMIEICNCQKIPIIPEKLPNDQPINNA